MADQLKVLKDLIISRLNEGIKSIEGNFDRLTDEEQIGLRKKAEQYALSIAQIDSIDSIEELVKFTNSFSDHKTETTDYKKGDDEVKVDIIPYEHLQRMEQRDIMLVKIKLEIESELIKTAIIYDKCVADADIDYIEEYLKTLDSITYERTIVNDYRRISITYKNASRKPINAFQADINNCLSNLYYGQLQKLREKKDSIVVNLSTLFNIAENLEKFGYTVTRKTDVEFTVTL